MLKHRNAYKGFTLVELAIVLAVMGLIIAGIWAAAATVSRKNKEVKASQQLLEIVKNVRDLYAGRPDATGITTESMIFSGAIPTEMQKSATQAVNPWGGDVLVEVSTAQRFYISYFGVPKSSCITLLMTTTTNASEIGLVNTSGGLPFPVDMTRATTACNVAATMGMRWDFNLRN